MLSVPVVAMVVRIWRSMRAAMSRAMKWQQSRASMRAGLWRCMGATAWGL